MIFLNAVGFFLSLLFLSEAFLGSSISPLKLHSEGSGRPLNPFALLVSLAGGIPQCVAPTISRVRNGWSTNSTAKKDLQARNPLTHSFE